MHGYDIITDEKIGIFYGFDWNILKKEWDLVSMTKKTQCQWQMVIYKKNLRLLVFGMEFMLENFLTSVCDDMKKKLSSYGPVNVK